MGFFSRQGRGRAAAGAGTRRKTRILIATLCLCAAAALAQEKPKVALYIANESLKPDEKSFLTNKLLKPFTQSGLYNVIDRSDIFTQKAAAERIKQRDGSVNDKEIYKIGYEAGAKYICMVELRKAFGRWNIAARMVDVVTAEIYLAQGETDIAGELDKADFSGAAAVIFDQIHGKRAVGGGAAQTQQAGADGPGVLIDNRDGKTYRTVVIGGKTWMAENLNYNSPKDYTWCKTRDSSTCDKYGRLYDWDTAKKACMAGWHLPSRQEWKDLVTAVGGEDVAGERLKAKSGWAYYYVGDKRRDGNGTDDYGFSALPGDSRSAQGGYNDKDSQIWGSWWTSTTDERDNSLAYRRTMWNNKDEASEGRYAEYKKHAYSVRCIKDN